MNNSEEDIIELEIDPDLFNDIYFHLEKDFNDHNIRFIFLYGGSSASKTYTTVQLTVLRMISMSVENSMVLRKYGVDIKDSIYSDFVNIINDFGLREYFKCQINYIECTLTGSFVRFRGLDDSEKIKGLTGFKRIILEEISQFDETDLKQIRKRLRGKSGQQIVGIFNPISETHWLKVNLFDKMGLIDQSINTDITSHQRNDKGNFVVYKVTYLNNKFIVGPHFIDKHTIEDFEHDKKTDFAYYQIYGLGNWGRIRTGGEFWKDFNPNIHVRKVKWDESKPIHLSWDENVNPYLTCEVWQIIGKEAIQIDEIFLEDPLNRVKHVCAEFKKRYPLERVQGLFLYGDRTSLKEDTKKEKGENFFTDIVSNLREYKPSLRLPDVNPSVVKSGMFINEIYAKNEGGINIIIGDNCKKSINDYTYALEDSDGTILKKKIKNVTTGVMFEEYGHASDAKRYILTMAFAREYIEYQRGGQVSKILSAKSISSKNIR